MRFFRGYKWSQRVGKGVSAFCFILYSMRLVVELDQENYDINMQKPETEMITVLHSAIMHNQPEFVV